MKKIALALCIAALVLAGCSSKPSKESVKSSFRKVLEQELSASASKEQKAAIKSYADCVIERSYDDLSADTLNKFVNAKNAAEFKDVNGSEKEKDVLEKAAEECAEKLVSESGEDN